MNVNASLCPTLNYWFQVNLYFSVVNLLRKGFYAQIFIWLKHRSFHVNIAKIFKNSFFIEHLCRCNTVYRNGKSQHDFFWLFIKRQTSGISSDKELYKEWQRMTTSDNEWQRVVQRVTTSSTTSDNEWQQRLQRMTRSDNEWQGVTASDNEWSFRLI